MCADHIFGPCTKCNPSSNRGTTIADIQRSQQQPLRWRLSEKQVDNGFHSRQRPITIQCYAAKLHCCEDCKSSEPTLRLARPPMPPRIASTPTSILFDRVVGALLCREHATRRLAVLLVGLALLSSGAAGLCNQVIWQRALKIFLGGSETISSMIVVLVFMAGLGVGSIWMGRRTASLKDPLRTFMVVETSLCVANLAVCMILQSDLGDSVFALQSLAVGLGIPLKLLYAISATLILAIPCLLMGATMPLAAEVSQRRLGLTDPRVLGLLFFVNTFGSVAGTVLASGYMMSHWGQTASLEAAAGLNLLAATMLGLMLLFLPRTSVSNGCDLSDTPQPTSRRHILQPSLEEMLALGLGFCQLGYEM